MFILQHDVEPHSFLSSFEEEEQRAPCVSHGSSRHCFSLTGMHEASILFYTTGAADGILSSPIFIIYRHFVMKLCDMTRRVISKRR
jgi:hypothetical protein